MDEQISALIHMLGMLLLVVGVVGTVAWWVTLPSPDNLVGLGPVHPWPRTSSTRVVWVVAKISPMSHNWEIQGIWDTEQQAVKQCCDAHWFIGPVQMNVGLPENPIAWPGARFPIKQEDASH